MSIVQTVGYRWRGAVVAAGLLAASAACSERAHRAPVASSEDAPGGQKVPVAGYPSLHWGMTQDEFATHYPDATPELSSGLKVSHTSAGREVVTTFRFDEVEGLIAYSDSFPREISGRIDGGGYEEEIADLVRDFSEVEEFLTSRFGAPELTAEGVAVADRASWPVSMSRQAGTVQAYRVVDGVVMRHLLTVKPSENPRLDNYPVWVHMVLHSRPES